MPAKDHPVALVTGAAKRLGAAMVRALHDKGYNVIIHYHDSEREALALADELNDIRAESIVTVREDFAIGDPASSLIEATERSWARLDLLVNNASIFDKTPLDDIDLASWERIHSINLRSPYFLSIASAPLLRKASGSIVNIADIHAERPRAEYSAYCASKAGLVAITRALAIEMAPAVRVNCVSPGAILWAKNESPAVQKNTIQATPLRRHGDPEDIAKAVCFLAEAKFVTGHTVNVDGGRLVRI
jgi:pteridine reductase